jgi:PAS domain S-box-containing protein
MESIRVLYVEDDASDRELTQRHVERYASHLKLTTVATVAEGIERVRAGDLDVVLADYRLPDGTGLDLLEVVATEGLSIPVVLVTGSGDPATAIRLLKAGAADYLVKRGNYLRSLPQVLDGAIERHRITHELRQVPARILHVEHNQADVALTERAFEGHGSHLRLVVVASGVEALARLRARTYDLVLLDYRLPDLSGIEVLRSLHQEKIRVPVVMVTGQGDEEIAAQAFKLGAADYIVKGPGYLAKLPSTLENVLARRRLEEERNALTVLNALSVSLAAVRDARELAEMVIRSACELLSADLGVLWLREDEALRPAASMGLDALLVPLLELRVTDALDAGAVVARRVTIEAVRAAAGTAPEIQPVFDELSQMLAISLTSSGRVIGLLSVAPPPPRAFGRVEERLLTALANHAAIAIENLRLYLGLAEQSRARERLAAVMEATTDLVAVAEPHGRLLYLNRAGRQLMGIEPDADLDGLRAADLMAEAPRARVDREIVPELARDGTWSGEVPFRSRSGREFPVWAVASAHPPPPQAVEFVSVIARDITERRHLEEQLRHSQKMEAVGLLAGGVAHDFNNLLTVIGGRSALLLERGDLSGAVLADVDLIRRTADRAAALTRQLLAFSRKQVLDPRPVELNTLVGGVVPMLRRLIGEDIELVIVAGPDLGHVVADPGQVEQVIMNLVVNARDAMPDGGTVRIETARRELTQDVLHAQGRVPPGPYTALIVQDAGHGMDEATLSRIFEPFFTTKEPGKGTGLGLSTVHGIVHQSGGHIGVDSAPRRGTTFTIYFPRVGPGAAATEAATASVPDASRGTETVLLVEDEEDVRELTSEILQRVGYTVLETGDPLEALTVAERRGGAIDLLVTDMVMPAMGGSELAERLRATCPGLRVLYMSGYAKDMNVPGGADGPGSRFLQKPFTPQDLARKVRETLST